MSSDTGDIINGLRTIVQALRVSSRQAEKTAGLSGAQLFVLAQLATAETLSLNELAGRTHTHQSSVSVVVAKLVEEKLIDRSRSKSDARQLVLSLTAKGRKRLEQAPKTAQDMLFEGLQKMAPRERKMLAQTLRKLIATSSMSNNEPQLFFETTSRKKNKKA
jgi:MarR family transcriptional regulator, lower aerobic nicotinate degradation pathway regulator